MREEVGEGGAAPRRPRRGEGEVAGQCQAAGGEIRGTHRGCVGVLGHCRLLGRIHLLIQRGKSPFVLIFLQIAYIFFSILINIQSDQTVVLVLVIFFVFFQEKSSKSIAYPEKVLCECFNCLSPRKKKFGDLVLQFLRSVLFLFISLVFERSKFHPFWAKPLRFNTAETIQQTAWRNRQKLYGLFDYVRSWSLNSKISTIYA